MSNEYYAHDPEHIENRKLFAEGVAAFGKEAERKHWECIHAFRLRREKNPNWLPLRSNAPHWSTATEYRRRADAPAIPGNKRYANVRVHDPDHTENRKLYEAGVKAFGEEAERSHWECADLGVGFSEWFSLHAPGPCWFSNVAYRRRADAPTIPVAEQSEQPRQPEAGDPTQQEVDSRNLVFHHPFFEGCEDDVGGRKDSLVEVMLGRLDRASEVFATSAYKYADTLSPFVGRMVQELYANSSKGDRSGWRSMSAEEVMLELHHHVGKLQKAALKEENRDAIFEHAADVANISMMVADVCGCLGEPKPENADESATRPISRTSVLFAVKGARKRGTSDDTIKRVLGGFSKGEATGPSESHVTHMDPKDFATVISLLNAL